MIDLVLPFTPLINIFPIYHYHHYSSDLYNDTCRVERDQYPIKSPQNTVFVGITLLCSRAINSMLSHKAQGMQE